MNQEILKAIVNDGILVIIAVVFLWQYIEERKERASDRELSRKDTESLIKALENNTSVLTRSDDYHADLSNTIELNQDELKDILGAIQLDVGRLNEKIDKGMPLQEEDKAIIKELIKAISNFEKQ